METAKQNTNGNGRHNHHKLAKEISKMKIMEQKIEKLSKQSEELTSIIADLLDCETDFKSKKEKKGFREATRLRLYRI